MYYAYIFTVPILAVITRISQKVFKLVLGSRLTQCYLMYFPFMTPSFWVNSPCVRTMYLVWVKTGLWLTCRCRNPFHPFSGFQPVICSDQSLFSQQAYRYKSILLAFQNNGDAVDVHMTASDYFKWTEYNGVPVAMIAVST